MDSISFGHASILIKNFFYPLYDLVAIMSKPISLYAVVDAIDILCGTREDIYDVSICVIRYLYSLIS